MPHYETKRMIHADPQAIWPILTDAARLSDGTFSIIRIEGSIARGQTIKLWSEADPQRAFAIKVSVFDPPHRMVWENGLPFGLFKGARSFVLTPRETGTEFHMREDYTGLLKNVFFRMIPDLQPTFEKFADALKAAAEAVAR